MDGRVESVRALLEAEGCEDPAVEHCLLVCRVGQLEEGRFDARCVLHELGEDGPDRPEHIRDLGRRHVRLEVVEERRVRRVLPLEALDVAALQVEVALERGKEAREVVLRARLDPDLVAERGRADHLGAELGGNAALLLPVAARDADEARIVGVVVERLLEWLQSLEQASDLRVGESLVRDPADRRECFGPSRVTAGRHRHLLIPAEHASRTREIRDLGEALTERAKVRVHLGGLYRRR